MPAARPTQKANLFQTQLGGPIRGRTMVNRRGLRDFRRLRWSAPDANLGLMRGRVSISKVLCRAAAGCFNGHGGIYGKPRMVTSRFLTMLSHHWMALLRKMKRTIRLR